MIQEVIIVEGKSDIAKLKQAVDAEIIATEGFTLRKAVLKQIRIAYERRGIIILTDPDGAGERIRKYLTKLFPQAKHAFIPKEEAMGNGDIGVEQATPEAIQKVLSKVRMGQLEVEPIFFMSHIIAHDLTGTEQAQGKRAFLGARLGIGYSNAKQFLYRLNHYGVTMEEWNEAVHALEKELENE